MITIDDFTKLEFKVGTVISAEEIDGSEKLLKLQVDFGSKVPETSDDIPSEDGIHTNTLQSDDDKKKDIRQILSGIKQWYKPEDLVGKQFVFITNLAPRKMMGLESQGMIMAAEGEERPVPLIPSEKVPNGSKIR